MIELEICKSDLMCRTVAEFAAIMFTANLLVGVFVFSDLNHSNRELKAVFTSSVKLFTFSSVAISKHPLR